MKRNSHPGDEYCGRVNDNIETVYFAGVGNGNRVGHAAVHRGGRHFGHDHGHYHSVHLRPVVHVLRPGLRDPVPAVDHGRPFQTLLQHVRVAVRVHRGVLHPNGRRRTAVGPRAHDLLSRVGRRKTTVPVQDHGHALFAVHADIRLVGIKVSGALSIIIIFYSARDEPFVLSNGPSLLSKNVPNTTNRAKKIRGGQFENCEKQKKFNNWTVDQKNPKP